MVVKETSAGFVIFYRKDNNIKFLLLKNSKGHWDFPKGHVEKGETLIEGAKRELYEEAGIKNVRTYPNFSKKISYYYSEDGERKYKEVYFFLGEVESQEVTLSFEHEDYKWVSYEEGMKILPYKESKEVLYSAYEFIRKYIIE